MGTFFKYYKKVRPRQSQIVKLLKVADDLDLPSASQDRLNPGPNGLKSVSPTQVAKLRKAFCYGDLPGAAQTSLNLVRCSGGCVHMCALCAVLRHAVMLHAVPCRDAGHVLRAHRRTHEQHASG